ncbi:MAG: GNAT family N-acetyltransferase [Rhizobiales bacterium]|nr:GNAT family N-acetyltransferase [Hyphomicrobiales bacterium]
MPPVTPVTLKTERLILRPWRDSDLAPFAAMNADPQVMEHFPAPMTRAESDAMVEAFRKSMAAEGYGRWVMELPGIAPCIGMTGLSAVPYETPFTPAHELAWRMDAAFWGHGYATEAARAAMAYGFEVLDLPEIVAFTVPANIRSQAVMQRLGMRRNPNEDFDHPNLPEGHPLRRHVLYRMTKEAWHAAGNR